MCDFPSFSVIPSLFHAPSFPSFGSLNATFDPSISLGLNEPKVEFNIDVLALAIPSLPSFSALSVSYDFSVSLGLPDAGSYNVSIAPPSLPIPSLPSFSTLNTPTPTCPLD